MTCRRSTSTLPGGERIALPFTSDFGSDPVDCSASGEFRLDTSLMFGVDEAVRAYGESSGLPAEVNGRVRIGYVYLAVRFESFLHPVTRRWSSGPRRRG